MSLHTILEKSLLTFWRELVNRNAVTTPDSGKDIRIISLSKCAKNLFQVYEVRSSVLHPIGKHGLCQHSRS